MSDDDRYTRITLRIPKELTLKLKEVAESRSHSMNAEIIQRLEDSLPDESYKLTQDEIDERLLDAAELYVISADDESIMRLLSKRFIYRK